MFRKCFLNHPETGKQIPAEILNQEKLRIVVRPVGTEFEVFLMRGTTGIPYRGTFKGQNFTVQAD